MSGNGEAFQKKWKYSQREIYYHLLDKTVSAEKYGRFARERWGIENSLHWILDIHFREDVSTANTDHAPTNLALLHKIAFNLTKRDPAMAKRITKKNDRFHDRS